MEQSTGALPMFSIGVKGKEDTFSGSKKKKNKKKKKQHLNPSSELNNNSRTHAETDSLPPVSKKSKKGGKFNPGGGGGGGSSIASRHPFASDYGDHFETPLIAYQHIQPILEKVAKSRNIKQDKLRIYDPFYCEGSVVKHLASLGFHTVIHENVDFWNNVKRNTVPEYDILVTNPPFSGDHKEKILEFCVKSNKPWALLLPNYVATKSYYSDTLVKCAPSKTLKSGSSGGGGGGSDNLSNRPPLIPQPFFVVPTHSEGGVSIETYQFAHPEGTGHAVSPFDSFWIVDIFSQSDNLAGGGGGDVLGKGKGKGGSKSPQDRLLLVKALKESMMKSNKTNVRTSSSSVVIESVEELKRLKLVPTAKRLNPKQRKKLAAKRFG